MKPNRANTMMVTKRKPISNFQPNTYPPLVCLIRLSDNNINDSLVNLCGGSPVISTFHSKPLSVPHVITKWRPHSVVVNQVPSDFAVRWWNWNFSSEQVTLPLEETGLMWFVAFWGMAFGGVPVAWSNWVALSVPDQAKIDSGVVAVAVHMTCGQHEQ